MKTKLIPVITCHARGEDSVSSSFNITGIMLHGETLVPMMDHRYLYEGETLHIKNNNGTLEITKDVEDMDAE